MHKYKVDSEGRFILDNGSVLSNDDIILQGISPERLQYDKRGRYLRNWRSHVKSPDDIWNEIVKASQLPGVTSAPKLQP